MSDSHAPTPPNVDSALVARYLCVIGIVLLVSDHIASFRQERTLIWPLRPSFSKYGFLVNRYLVTLALVALFLPLGGFLGLDFSSRSCGWIISVVAGVLACCIVLDCCMATARVESLWVDRKSTILVWVVSILSYGAHIATLVIAFAHMRPHIMWFPLVMDGQLYGLNMCSLTYIDRLMLIANALPLPLELFMLFAVGFKYQELRRGGPSRLLKYTVAREGMQFFAVATALRAIHLGIVATFNPSIMTSMVLVSFTSVTAVLSNHRVLATRSARLAGSASRAKRAVSGGPSGSGRGIQGVKHAKSTHSFAPQAPAELGHKDMNVSLSDGADAIELRRADFGMGQTSAHEAEELA